MFVNKCDTEIVSYEKNNIQLCYNYAEYCYNCMMISNALLYLCFIFILYEKICIFNNTEQHLYNLIWSALKYYCIIQTYINRYIISPSKLIVTNNYKRFKYIISGIPDKYVIVRDGEEIMRFKKINELIGYYLFNKNVQNDDLICYRNDNFIYYTKIQDFIYNDGIIEKTEPDNDLNKLEVSLIKFMTCNISVKIMGKDLFIQRPVDLNRFMVVGNKILNKSFVFWYCNKYLNLNKNYIEDYKIHIIDQDVDQIEIDTNEYIEIHKDEYVIHKTNHYTLKSDPLDDDEDTPINEVDKIIDLTCSGSDTNAHCEDTNDDNDDKYDGCNNQNECKENIQLIADDDYHNKNEDLNECKYHNNLENDSELFTQAIDEYANSSWLNRFILF